MTKIAMRRAWFQVHKWIGLILAVLIIPISITGAALVWDDAFDRLVNPTRYATTGDAVIAPDRYVAAALPVLKPGERIATLTMPEHRGPVTVAINRGVQKGGGRPVQTMLYLDPPTARVLELSSSNAGLTRLFHGLHGSLLVPGIGRQIVGWIGVAMLVSTFTGLWLWWPTVGKWARGLRWRRHRNVDTNLHHLFGFWIALPLFVLSLTGAWISFPAFFAGLTGASAPRGPGGPDRMAMMRARPLESPRQSLDGVLAAAKVSPAAIRSIGWPTDLKAEWTVRAAGAKTALTVADADATVAIAPPREPGNPTAQLMRRLHDGHDMGPVWQTLVFLGGILPAVLAVTGLIMWWRARGWKADLARRQKARRAVA